MIRGMGGIVMNLASFRKSANCYLSSKARRRPHTRRPESKRLPLLIEQLEGRVVPSSITLTGSAMQNGFLNQAQVEFDLSGSNLTVTLTNTATQTFNSTNTLVPTNVLTGVLFDIAGNTSLGALTPGNANLASGSHMLTTGSPPTTSTIDTSASGWGYGTPTGGTFNGQHYGIEAFGGISTASLANFANSNTPPNVAMHLDGLDYGIIGPGYVSGGNGGVTSENPFEQTAEVFHFTVNSSTFTDVSQISNVSFQYGTANGDAAFPPTTKASPAISTTANPSSVTLSNTGSPTLKDSATLSGGLNPTGTITFTLYGLDGTTVVDTETATVSGDGTYSTPTGFTLPTTGTVTGTYQWVASYGGDGNNNAVSSIKGDEPVTVTAASPTISTTANPEDVALDGSGSPTLKDSATLSGGYNESGTITFTLYAPGGSVVDTETETVSGNGTYTTPTGYTLPTTGMVTGTYQWVASYSGDANNTPVSSSKGEEPVTVEPASPTISTTTNPTQVTVGTSPFNDSASLSKGYNPTGTITFTLSAPDGTTVYSDHVTVNGNGVYSTTSGDNPGGYVPLVAGTYQWVASYSGDGNNSALSSPKGAEPVIATPAISFLTTTAIPSSVTLDNTGSPTLKDSGTLTGGVNPTGTLTFTLYAPNGTTVLHTESVTVNGNGTYTTPTGYTLPTTGAVTGTYQWVASYSGDSNNPAVSSSKGDEPVAVEPASPTISTTANPEGVALDGSGSPDAQGLGHAVGRLQRDRHHHLHAVSRRTATSVIDTETATVSGNGTYSTPTGYTLPTTGTVTGTYQWVASYSGDANNTPVSQHKGTSQSPSSRRAPRSARRPIRRMSRWMAAGPRRSRTRPRSQAATTRAAPSPSRSTHWAVAWWTPRPRPSAATAHTLRQPATRCRRPAR